MLSFQKISHFFILLLILTLPIQAQEQISFSALAEQYPFHSGFTDIVYDSDNDKFYIRVAKDLGEFIYQTSLPSGLGSNDIGLDRGQLSNTRLVSFTFVGKRALLMQTNTAYRAGSDNPAEVTAIKDSFASAILWSFPIVESDGEYALLDATDFLLQDQHGVISRLKRTKQGSYSLDKKRSIVALENSKSFPDNTEMEVWLTFTGKEPGKYVRQAAIDPTILSMRLRHSFIRLPDDKYTPLTYHPDSGYFDYKFEDYAVAVNQPLTQRFIPRHRLSKKEPQAAQSEALEPIIYYVDSGVPEPVKSALIDGGKWWNHAFEDIGYNNAFQVKELPENADPMDVRYNVIQWVHRATRGWSYGMSVIDPRTGEIIKGHVSLGSLRIRQDYLIAQALLAPFAESDEQDQQLQQLALARIRQLSAHEVGHTLGLAHNFAASSYNRASVMDYPHPYVTLDNGKLDTSNAYTNDIGIWDKRAIAYGYDDLTDAQRIALIQENRDKGYYYLSDADSRDLHDAHPLASLWDNGSNATQELLRMNKVRRFALDQFGLNNLHKNRPVSDLEEVLVPLYYFHRYQAEATGKLLGGYQYFYDVKGQTHFGQKIVSPSEQAAALDSLLGTLQPAFLQLGEAQRAALLPKARGYYRDRESINGATGLPLDYFQLAGASMQHTLNIILHSQRLLRVAMQHRFEANTMSVKTLLARTISAFLPEQLEKQSDARALRLQAINLLVSNLLNRYHSNDTPELVKRELSIALQSLQKKLEDIASDRSYKVVADEIRYEARRISQGKSSDPWTPVRLPELPLGSPI
ncbi:MAG: zinc-dependent metalloprotease [Aestuariibacter sp.]